MRATAVSLVAVLLAVGCNSNDDPSESLRMSSLTTGIQKDNKELARRLTAIEAHLLDAQKKLVQEQQRGEDLRRRLVAIESLFARELSAAAPTAEPDVIETAIPAPSVRSAAVEVTTNYLQPKQDEAPRRQRPASVESGPSWNDVMAASDYMDAFAVINRHCSGEWPANPRMQNYCAEKQHAAVAALKRGKPFSADDKTWNRARVSCAQEWPDDYAMRLYCEGRAAK